MNNTFKQTDIGIIPEDWNLFQLSDLTKITSGGTPSRTKPEYYTGNYLWVKSGELEDNIITNTEEKITDEAIQNSSAKLFPKETVLIAMYGATVGKTAILNKEATTNQAVCAILPNYKLFSPEYLRFYVMTIRDKYLSQRYGGAQPNISQTIIKNTIVPLPPLPEQRKIAHVLSKIQQAIETQEQIIKTTQELKKALMQKLFTEGLNNEPQKQTEIGPIPESWEVVTIGDVCEQRKESYSPDPDGNSIYVGLEHITTGEFYLSNHSYENTVVSSKYKFYNDDLLYGKLRPYLDKAVLVNSNGVCSTDIIVIKPKIDNKFLLSLLHTEKLLKHSIAHTSGVNHPRTSFDALSRFKFVLPNPTEQKAIGYAIFKLEDKIITHQNYRNQLKDVFSSMLNQLMSGQIRVKDIEFKLAESINTPTCLLCNSSAFR